MLECQEPSEMVAKHAGRSTRRYKLLKKQFRAQCAERDEKCHLCDQEIDYDLQWPNDACWTLDHFYSVSEFPQHAEDPANFRASHQKCNLSRGNKKVQWDIGKRTRDW